MHICVEFGEYYFNKNNKKQVVKGFKHFYTRVELIRSFNIEEIISKVVENYGKIKLGES